MKLGATASSSGNDIATSLSLSLPGPKNGPGAGPVMKEKPRNGDSEQLWSKELLKVMQDMIRVEVWNYMSGLERREVFTQTDGIRNSERSNTLRERG